MKKLVALSLAVIMLVGSSIVYADESKTSVANNKPAVVDVTSLKDDSESLMLKGEPSLSTFDKDKDGLWYRLDVNGMIFYPDYTDFELRKGEKESVDLYKTESDVEMIPLRVISEMMGANFVNKTETTVTFEKDGKKFMFEKGSKIYKENGVEKELRHEVEDVRGVYFIPLYDLVKIYNMNIAAVTDRKQLNTIQKASQSKDKYMDVQLIIWDKDFKMFKRDNPELNKIADNFSAWYAERSQKGNPLYNPELHYVLVDTKTKFSLLKRSLKDGTAGFDLRASNRFIRGTMSMIIGDKIQYELLGHVYAENGRDIYRWIHAEDNLGDKSLAEELLKRSDYLGFHHFKTNTMTIVPLSNVKLSK